MMPFGGTLVAQGSVADLSAQPDSLTGRFLAQPMRLDFRLLDATSDAIRSNSSDATSPICGWLLPNHLDNSLMVFDAAGQNLGELIEIVKDEGTGVRWDAAPGSDAPRTVLASARQGAMSQ